MKLASPGDEIVSFFAIVTNARDLKRLFNFKKKSSSFVSIRDDEAREILVPSKEQKVKIKETLKNIRFGAKKNIFSFGNILTQPLVDPWNKTCS